ncbi:MAG: YceI family protein [Bacteroidales bacterium]|nr:YceI family protein [Bacteroidales bacterium]
MKMKKMNLLILLVGLTALVSAQTRYNLDNTGSSIVVEGTSSVHDWEMEANGLKSAVVLHFNDNKLTEIKDAEFSCLAENVVSDNSIMNNKTHDALKAKKHPQISFRLKSVDRLDVTGNSVSGEVSGILKIAGVSQSIRFNFTGHLNPGHMFTISGTVPLMMSDFNIDPPTAMLGALKTGDKVKINFKFIYKS